MKESPFLAEKLSPYGDGKSGRASLSGHLDTVKY